ncbi:23195_t:CDS:1, partial [Gigaspora rosea]
YDDAKKEYEEAKGKLKRLLERLTTLKLGLAASKWESKKEKNKQIMEKQLLEQEEGELEADVKY